VENGAKGKLTLTSMDRSNSGEMGKKGSGTTERKDPRYLMRNSHKSGDGDSKKTQGKIGTYSCQVLISEKT